jgi:phenylpyruvate tautomerase PptA (4-oxalocrotonate tautomerase family)
MKIRASMTKAAAATSAVAEIVTGVVVRNMAKATSTTVVVVNSMSSVTVVRVKGVPAGQVGGRIGG